MDGGNSKNIGKFNVKVKFLDGHVDIFSVNMNSLGSELFQKVSIRTKLLENYFFGLSFESPELDLCWLDLRKVVRKQFNVNNEYLYEFCVKFYSPDPNMLQDSLTKQLFVLQLKTDLSTGELICCDSTKILLGAFFLKLQYPSSKDLDPSLLEGFLRQLFLDKSSLDILIRKSLDFYATLKDQTPEQTQYDLLETVRKIDFYGMKMHPAKDIEGVSLNLAVYHMGIVVFQQCTKINTFNWSRIRKLSFKRKRFLIKLHSEEYLELFILWVVQGFYKDTLEFYFDTRNRCKNFWKKCIEHHSFFRSHTSRSNHSSTFDRCHGFRRNFSGSRFRYVGPTQTELVQMQIQPLGINNCVHRSESAGRLIPRDISLQCLTGANYLDNHDSMNCLSYSTEPSSKHYIDEKIGIQHRDSSPALLTGNTCPWNKISQYSPDTKWNMDNLDACRPVSDVSQCSSGDNCFESRALICSSGGGLNSVDDIQLTLANYSHTLPSLIATTDVRADTENKSFFSISLPIVDIFSYEFIPKLLAQALSSEECSYEFPVSGIDHIAHGEESTNNGSCSRSFVSTSINSDTSTCASILNSMIKDFLFNEFTHIKEMHVLKEIIDCDSPITPEIIGLLDTLISATKTLIFRLEVRVQFNTQSQDNYLTSANDFFLIVDEFLSQTLEIFKLYLNCVENFVTYLPNRISPPICLCSSQLQYLTKSLFHAKNPFRLLLSVIFHQRNRHRCIVTMYDFIITKEEERRLCKVIMDTLKSCIASVDQIEEEAQQLLLVTAIEGIQKLPHIRFGWLQRLSSKGASNRIFTVNCHKLICIKKFQSNAFIVEQSWRLEDIRVGLISEMTNHSNGFNIETYPFEQITIMLTVASGHPADNSNVIIIANSKKAQLTWINEINNVKSKNSQMPKNSDSECHSKIDKAWVQDYQLVDMCWHDRFSLSWDHVKILFQLVLSSYVLKKCKLSNGWQRFWIVLSDCHLYFYRNHSDREALTSMSLVGFKIMTPTLEDSINKDWVLKLTKDVRSYFLRTENQYFYHRWQTALQHCTSFTS